MKRNIIRVIGAAAALLVAGVQGALALTAGSYSVTVSKLNGNGTLSDLQTVSATADTSGKLSFTLSTLPTNADVNFLVFTIKDANGVIVRKGLVPAPPAGNANKIGINDLATVQADAFLKGAELAGSDDPVLAAYLLVLLRSPQVTPSDIVALGNLGKAAILGGSGFEGYVATNGATPAKLAALKKCLVYNPDGTKKTLKHFAEGFFNAVESTTAGAAQDEMQKAGGLMADVFMDAAACADIELGVITNAHEAAGDAAQASGYMGGISSTVMKSLDSSMSAFHRKVGMVKMVAEYTDALKVLGATGTQVDQFVAAATALAQASAAIDTQYKDFYSDPDAYLSSHPGSNLTTIKQAIDTLYQNAWTTFQSAIAASGADIAALKAAITTTLSGIVLPTDFGTFRDTTGTQKNWPVQQVVMVKWLVGLIANGGIVTYTRTTPPIPTMMQNWLGTCSNTQYWDMMHCQQNGGTWTSQRRDYSHMTPSAAFNSYLGLQEDVSIAEMTKFSIWDNNAQPTSTQRQTAELSFIAALMTIQGNFVATKNAAGMAVTDAEKEAMVKLMLQPHAD
ncbi:hypothetical protein [Geobacter pickeringii]|uniref:Uncharacterized protein n=1 Tax=Geobacter pickeringii TaxID=345632 RepID=A0A0B5BE29_9BACT|nr:hypothetical protein [Geobacter pickeringii]AJE02795.1 hypothetical protein GPICK_04915 [Geobacter pickeringii]